MLPKCQFCNNNFITAKSKLFARQEGVEDNICIYCLAEKTGKEVGRTGMLEVSKYIPQSRPSYTGVKTSAYQRSIKNCRPCLERRNRS